MNRKILIGALLSIVALLHAVSASAHTSDIAQSTTYSVAKLALIAQHPPKGVYLVGGQAGMKCDPYVQEVPTDIYCGSRTNFTGAKCFVSIHMRTITHSTGEVTCGKVAGAHKWVWRTFYVWNGHTYAWHGEQSFGKPV